MGMWSRGGGKTGGGEGEGEGGGRACPVSFEASSSDEPCRERPSASRAHLCPPASFRSQLPARLSHLRLTGGQDKSKDKTP